MIKNRMEKFVCFNEGDSSDKPTKNISLPIITGVDSEQKTFEFIDFFGEKLIATIYDNRKRIRVGYSNNSSKDVAVRDLIDGKIVLGSDIDFNDEVHYWLNQLMGIIEDQQRFIAYPKGDLQQWFYDGLKGKYSVSYLRGDMGDRISLTIPKMTITGTYTEFKRLELFFGMLEGGQLIRLLTLAKEKQQKDKNK